VKRDDDGEEERVLYVADPYQARRVRSQEDERTRQGAALERLQAAAEAERDPAVRSAMLRARALARARAERAAGDEGEARPPA
jgi:hypothetical protein